MSKLGFFSTVRRFPRTFWVANTMEIFERMAWYGFFAVSSLYITGPISEGALGFTSETRGDLQAIVMFILYLLPVFTGALGDRYGYKKTFFVAYLIMTPAYFLLGQFHSLGGFFVIFLMVALGAAIFKPVVVGTVARATDDDTRSLGFGIFYMMVNIGGFVGPVVAGMVRAVAWKWVFVMSAIWIGCNFLWLIFLYKEPTSESGSKEARSFKDVMNDIVTVLGNGRFFLTVMVVIVLLMTVRWLGWTTVGIISGAWVGFNIIYDIILRKSTFKKEKGLLAPMKLGDWRFCLFLLILSGFWTMFNQIFMTMPEYIRDFTDTTPILQTLQTIFGAIGLTGLEQKMAALIAEGYQINPEYIINIDAGAIIFFQILISWIVGRFKPFFTMIVGCLLAAAGVGLCALGVSGWIVVIAIVIFAVGEMAASPKSQEYIGRIAPKDKVALYMGYYFVTIALGNLFGGILSGQLYGKMARDQGNPELMWMIFAMIGVVTSVALVLYDRFVIARMPAQEEGAP